MPGYFRSIPNGISPVRENGSPLCTDGIIFHKPCQESLDNLLPVLIIDLELLYLFPFSDAETA